MKCRTCASRGTRRSAAPLRLVVGHCKMISNRKTKVIAWVGGLYCLLWILTATWGISDVDRAFDHEFASGSTGFAENLKRVSIQRIDSMADVRNLIDPAKELPDETGLFRYRSRGVAVADFVIIDQVSTVCASLGSFEGRRLCFWFFGFTKWSLLETYWNV